MSFQTLLPAQTRPWKFGEIPEAGDIVQVPDGLYAKTSDTGQLHTFARCACGRVLSTLRLTPGAEVRGRYDDIGFAQEYQVDSGETYLEDFGGRIEGPAYSTEQPFEEWVAQKLREVIKHGADEEGYRPSPKVFLNLGPAEFLNCPIRRKGTGTASSTGFFPTALGYILPQPESPGTLIDAAARLYLKDPVVETLEQASMETGFPNKMTYERWLLRAMDDQMDLFGVLFYRRFDGVVVVGFCPYRDRPLAEEGVLGCMKLFFHGLVREF